LLVLDHVLPHLDGSVVEGYEHGSNRINGKEVDALNSYAVVAFFSGLVNIYVSSVIVLSHLTLTSMCIVKLHVILVQLSKVLNLAVGSLQLLAPSLGQEACNKDVAVVGSHHEVYIILREIPTGELLTTKHVHFENCLGQLEFVPLNSFDGSFAEANEAVLLPCNAALDLLV
jgi:hypothetical protein